jgi:hypothetical protein
MECFAVERVGAAVGDEAADVAPQQRRFLVPVRGKRDDAPRDRRPRLLAASDFQKAGDVGGLRASDSA